MFLLCEQVSHGVTVQTAYDKKIIINIESLTTPLPPQIAYYVSNKYRDMNVTAIRMAVMAKQTYVPYELNKNQNYNPVVDSIVAAQKNHRVVVLPNGRRVKYVKSKKYPIYKRCKPKTYVRRKAPIRKTRSSKEYSNYRQQKTDFDWHQPDENDEETPLKASTNRLRAKHKQQFQKEGRYPYNIEPVDTSETSSEEQPLYGMVSAHSSSPRKKKKIWRSRGKYVMVKQNSGRNETPKRKAKSYSTRLEYPKSKKEKARLSYDTVPQKYRSKYTKTKTSTTPKSRAQNHWRVKPATPATNLPQQHTPYLPNVHDFILYLSKLNDTRNRETADDENEGHMSEQKEHFAPSHFLFTVRKTEKTLKKPTQQLQPAIKEQVLETGGHTVYTEDGYEDKAYDHAIENMDGSFNHNKPKRRSVRSPHIKPLLSKMRQIDMKIKNYRHYKKTRDSSPDRKKSNKSRNGRVSTSNGYLRNSPITYIESARSHGSIRSPMFYYKTKENLYNCAQPDAITFVTRNKTVISNTSSQTKRLNNLGEKIYCYRNKFFGNDPLNNQIFREEFINDHEFDIENRRKDN